MKVRVLSDLHLEFSRAQSLWIESIAPERDEKVLVLAGDIAVGNIFEVLEQFCAQWSHVVYVPGNHEFYESSVTKTLRRLNAARLKLSNLHWLNCNAVEIEGQRFVGHTLWFPTPPPVLTGEPDPRASMSDFYAIRELQPWVYEENERAQRWFEENVRAGDVVVTHHLPSHRSVGARYIGDPLNCFFVGGSRLRLDALMVDRGPKLWVHGHTHDSLDYMLGKTRVVCNPRGYEPNALNASFNPAFSVDV